MENKNFTRKWVRCKKCGHKLFRTVKSTEIVVTSEPFDRFIADGDVIRYGIEIKCHSCKEVQTI